MSIKDREYRSADGRPLPSVSTSLRRCYNDDGLAYWASQQGASYRDELEWRSQLGSMAHWYAEHGMGITPKGPPPGIDTGDPDKDAHGALLASSCAARLVAWWRASGLRVLSTETPYIHPTADYGGTPDVVAEGPDGVLVVVDWKTSGSPSQKHRLQVGAYCSLVSASTGRPCIGVVVCAGITGGDVKVSWVKGAMLERMVGAFGALRIAYGYLSKESMGGRDEQD